MNNKNEGERDAVESMRAWMSSDDDNPRPYPSADDFRDAIVDLLASWRYCSGDGLDICANSVLDEIAEITKAMRA